MNSQTSVASAPADLSTLRGVELLMNGMSERVPSGSTKRTIAPFTAAVFFKNHASTSERRYDDALAE